MDHSTAEKGYRVLARKYRPENFSDLIGQEPMVRTLTNAFETGRIAQAWMLTGVRGVGKTTTARILARALNYKTATIDRPTIDFTEPGEHCKAIMEGRDPDVVEMDAASHTGIDDIREIIEQVRYRPVNARYKVYIIDEVHMLSTQAFNGLLKTLEEPPPHVKFIFATTEIRKVPITVLSRCQRFDLRRIDAAQLTGLLRKISDNEKIKAEDKALATIARAAEGSARDALSILDQAIAHGDEQVSAETVRSMLGLADRTHIIDLFELIMNGDVAGALREFKNQYDAGAAPAVVLTDLAEFNHLVTRLRFTPELADDVSLAEEERERGKAFATSLSVRVLSRNWQMLLKGIEEVEHANRPVQAAEMLIIRLAHAADLPTLDEALKAISEGKAGSGIASPSGHGNAAPSPTSPTSSAVSSSALREDNLAGTRPTMQIVSQTAAVATSLPIAEAHFDPTADNKPKIAIHSLDDIIRLADEHREIAFKLLVKEFVRPVAFKPGHIEFEKAEGAPRELATQMMKFLREWTGERWAVSIVNEGGSATLAEQEAAERKALLHDAEADPHIQAVLNAFPGARIVDVRLNQADALDLAPADAPYDDDDDNE